MTTNSEKLINHNERLNQISLKMDNFPLKGITADDLGINTISNGTFILSTRSNEITINHNLGSKVQRIFIYTLEGTQKSIDYIVDTMTLNFGQNLADYGDYYYGGGIDRHASEIVSNVWDYYQGEFSCVTVIDESVNTENSITFNLTTMTSGEGVDISDTVKFHNDITYYWIAMA